MEYLPINISNEAKCSLNGGHLLARIDSNRFGELSRFRWNSLPGGFVFRQTTDVEASHAAGRSVNLRIPLAAVVLNSEARHRHEFFFKNADTLDFRAENITMIPLEPANPKVPPGSTFRESPEYAAALRLRPVLVAEMLKYVRRGRKPRLNDQQVEQLLRDVAHSPLLKGATLSVILEYIECEFGVKSLHPSEVSAILHRRKYPLPGLASTSSTIREATEKLYLDAQRQRLITITGPRK